MTIKISGGREGAFYKKIYLALFRIFNHHITWIKGKVILPSFLKKSDFDFVNRLPQVD